MGERLSPEEGTPSSRRLYEAARRNFELSRRAAELARVAAESSAEMVASMERLALLTPLTVERHRLAAAAQLRNEACQRAAARLHEMHMRQLQTWLARQGPRPQPPPVFMSAVAGVAGWQGAVLTLFTDHGYEGLVAASDPTARAAHELEVSLAEGPSWEAFRGGSPAVAWGEQLEYRWPRYGPAVRDLGFASVASVPIRCGRACRGGSLTVMEPCTAGPGSGVGGLREVADALTTVLTSPGVPGEDGDAPGLQVFEEEDFQPSLHAAAGALHERCGYDINDAIALIRAHAFAESRSVAEVADEVIHEALLL